MPLTNGIPWPPIILTPGAWRRDAEGVGQQLDARGDGANKESSVKNAEAVVASGEVDALMYSSLQESAVLEVDFLRFGIPVLGGS